MIIFVHKRKEKKRKKETKKEKKRKENISLLLAGNIK